VSTAQGLLLAILGTAILLFLWGRWRYDMVAVGALALLMAVAIGAACAFLTPIGHQNNTLILGPGGFRFGDYWRLDLPLEVIVVIVAVPLLLLVWT